MVLEVREIGPGLLQVVGSVDLTTVAGFREQLGDAVDRAVDDRLPVLSVDVHELELIDPAGLGVLLGAHRRARRAGSRLRLIRPTPELSQVFLVSRLYRVLDIEYDQSLTPGSLNPGSPTAESVPVPRAGAGYRRPLTSS